jgi:hypothetical protein
LELEPGVSSAEVEAESERAQLKPLFKKPHTHPGRQELPPDLPRVEQIILVHQNNASAGTVAKRRL